MIRRAEIEFFADELVERMRNTGKRLAVFVIDGHIRATAITTQIYASALQRHPEKLAGVYDRNADPKTIEEDILCLLETVK